MKKNKQPTQKEQTESTQENSFSMLQKAKHTSSKGIQLEQTSENLATDTIELLGDLGIAFDDLKKCISDKFKKVNIGEGENFYDYFGEREEEFSILNNHKKNDVKRHSGSIEQITKDVIPVVTSANHMVEMLNNTNVLKTVSVDKDSAKQVNNVLNKMAKDVDTFVDKHTDSGIGNKLIDLFNHLATQLKSAINQIGQYLGMRPMPK